MCGTGHSGPFHPSYVVIRRRVNRSLIWWLRHDPRGRRDLRFRLGMLVVWVLLWWLGWFPSDWFLPVIVLLHVGDLLLSYYWWRRDLNKAEQSDSPSQ